MTGCLVLVEQEALKRVLFIFAKLNPGIRYVQGMNEVLAPLYYVFKTDNDESNAVSATYYEQLCVCSVIVFCQEHCMIHFMVQNFSLGKEGGAIARKSTMCIEWFKPLCFMN